MPTPPPQHPSPISSDPLQHSMNIVHLVVVQHRSRDVAVPVDEPGVEVQLAEELAARPGRGEDAGQVAVARGLDEALVEDRGIEGLGFGQVADRGCGGRRCGLLGRLVVVGVGAELGGGEWEGLEEDIVLVETRTGRLGSSVVGIEGDWRGVMLEDKGGHSCIGHERHVYGF